MRRDGAVPMLVVFLVLLGFAGGYGHAEAQADSQDHWIAVSPPDIMVNIDPGASVAETVRFTNKASKAITVRVYAKDLGLVAAGDGKYWFGDSDEGDVNRGIGLEIPGLASLPPGATVDFEFRVSSSAEAEPGTHYKGIVLEAYDPDLPQTVQQIRTVLIVPVIVTVRGEVDDSGAIVEFRPAKLVFDGLPAELRLTWKNQGNVMYKIGGRVEVVDKHDRMVGEMRVEADKVFPRTKRTVSLVWDRNLKSLLTAGTYKAKALVFYGRDGARKAEAEVEFRVVPYTWIRYGTAVAGGVLLLVVITAFVTALVVRRRSRGGGDMPRSFEG